MIVALPTGRFWSSNRPSAPVVAVALPIFTDAPSMTAPVAARHDAGHGRRLRRLRPLGSLPRRQPRESTLLTQSVSDVEKPMSEMHSQLTVGR